MNEYCAGRMHESPTAMLFKMFRGTLRLSKITCRKKSINSSK